MTMVILKCQDFLGAGEVSLRPVGLRQHDVVYELILVLHTFYYTM